MHSSKQYANLVKGVSKRYKTVSSICLSVVAVIAFLIVSGHSLKIASLMIGIISLVIAITYTSISYRCYVLLTNMSTRGASNRNQTRITPSTASYARIARFTLSLSAMYCIGRARVPVSHVSELHLFA